MSSQKEKQLPILGVLLGASVWLVQTLLSNFSVFQGVWQPLVGSLGLAAAIGGILGYAVERSWNYIFVGIAGAWAALGLSAIALATEWFWPVQVILAALISGILSVPLGRFIEANRVPVAIKFLAVVVGLMAWILAASVISLHILRSY